MSDRKIPNKNDGSQIWCNYYKNELADLKKENERLWKFLAKLGYEPEDLKLIEEMK